MAGVIAALVSGALMSIQGVFNTEVTKAAGMWAANGWAQLTALGVCVAAWLLTERGDLGAIFTVKPYFLLGGAIGAFITATVIWAMNGLGPAKAVLIIVVSQILVAYLIELFGFFGVPKAAFEWKKLLGVGLAVVGIIITKW